MAESAPGPSLKREMGFADLALFYIVSGLGLRWVVTAAAAGPSSIAIWLMALVGFFIPLAACVIELSSRYPQEGGLYVWTGEAFGDFSAFIAAWTYWMSNLPFFAAVLYFAAAAALVFAGSHTRQLTGSPAYYISFAVICLVVITGLNVIGLKSGKWLNNVGAFGSWIAVALLILLGALSVHRFGSATHFTLASMVPHASMSHFVFWSTIFFAFGGCEAGSFMGEEIKDARRTIPHALIFAGCVLVVGYIAGTTAMLVALPSASISSLSGFMAAVELMCRQLHLLPLAAVIGLLVTVSSVGGVAAFLGATSRLPFVAGIDHYLPPVFGRIHPHWRTPYVAIIVYGLAGMLFAFLGQAGTTVRGAYDVLVSMSIITFFIPYLFLFAAMIRLQDRPAPPGAIRVFGGRPVAILLASIGLVSTVATIVLSVFPSAEETNKILAVGKILGLTFVMVGAGVLVYLEGRRRIRRERAGQSQTV